MGEPGIDTSTSRPLSAIAGEMLDIWWDKIQPDGRLAWDLGVLCYGHGINDLLQTEDDALVLPADLVRYVLLALPRTFVLCDVSKEQKTEKLKAELRAMVGGDV